MSKENVVGIELHPYPIFLMNLGGIEDPRFQKGLDMIHDNDFEGGINLLSELLEDTYETSLFSLSVTFSFIVSIL